MVTQDWFLTCKRLTKQIKVVTQKLVKLRKTNKHWLVTQMRVGSSKLLVNLIKESW